jgi:hypothetical protein
MKLRRWPGAVLLLSLAARADLPARLRGEVRGADGTVPDEVEVSLICGGTPVRTAAAARFLFDDLPPGHCQIRASARDHAGEAAVNVELAPGAETAVALTVGPERRPWIRDRASGSNLVPVLPLPARRVEVLLQTSGAFDGDRGPAGSAVAGALYGNQFRLDGFDVTDPLQGGPGLAMPLAGVAAVEIAGAGQGVDAASASGVTATLVTMSGSNSADFDLMASELRRPGGLSAHDTEAAASSRGPLLKDHLWLSTAAEGRWLSGGGSTVDGLGKLSWQASPRHKVTVLAAGSGGPQAGGLGGVTWESLLTDTLVARVYAGARTHAGPAGSSAQGGQGGLDLWSFVSGGGEHALRLVVRGEALTAHVAAGTTPGRRGLLALEDGWRPTRHLTITPGIAYVAGDFETPGASWRARGLAPALGLVWDLTHDGRTALRASGSGRVDAGSFASAAALAEGSAPARRIWEASAGIEREILQGLAAHADVIQRWRPGATPAGDAPAAEHRGLSMGVRKVQGRRRMTASYTRQTTRGATTVFSLTATEQLPGAIGVGLLASYANRGVWARLLAPPGAPPPPITGGEAWFLGLNLHAGLAPLLGEPVVAWIDAVALTSAPGVRLGVAWAY